MFSYGLLFWRLMTLTSVLSSSALCADYYSDLDELVAKGEHHGHHHGGHHSHHHGRHHDHHHHWHHSHHSNWWHHAAHPGWEHHHYSHWHAYHNPWHNWYWYGGAGALGVAALAAYESQYPGYYYDPNYYYELNGVPSVEYEYDEPADQPPGKEVKPLSNPASTPSDLNGGHNQASSSSHQAGLNNPVAVADLRNSAVAQPQVKKPAEDASVNDEKDFEDVDVQLDDDREDDEDTEDKNAEKSKK